MNDVILSFFLTCSSHFSSERVTMLVLINRLVICLNELIADTITFFWWYERLEVFSKKSEFQPGRDLETNILIVFF